MKSSHQGYRFTIVMVGLAKLEVLILQSFNKKAKITNAFVQYLPKASLCISTIRQSKVISEY